MRYLRFALRGYILICNCLIFSFLANWCRITQEICHHQNRCYPYLIATQLWPGFLYYYGYRLKTAGWEMSDSVRVRGTNNPWNSTGSTRHFSTNFSCCLSKKLSFFSGTAIWVHSLIWLTIFLPPDLIALICHLTWRYLSTILIFNFSHKFNCL